MIFSKQYHEEIQESGRESESREEGFKGGEEGFSLEEYMEGEKTREEEESSNRKKERKLMEYEIHVSMFLV